MKSAAHRRGRRGAALIMALVALACVTIVLSTITAQVVSQRLTVRRQERQRQAEWLARAGVELAAARLLDSPAPFVDDKQELIGDSKLRIAVEKADKDSFAVKVEAQVGLAEGRTVVREASARFRRTDKGGAVRLETIP